MQAKCKRKGCYEPADCRHGYCHKHCAKGHKKLDYSTRQYPKTSEPHVGVEIEVEFDSETDMQRAIPLKGHHDGSLPDCSAEFKVLASAKKIIAKASKLVEELWKRRAKVTNRCGLHVHLDARNINQNRLADVFRWFKLTEDVWFSMMPPSRRSNNYVRKLVLSKTRLPNDHYFWVHLTPYGTLELRIHGGTVNPHKLSGWLAVCIHLLNKLRDSNYQWPTHADALAKLESMENYDAAVENAAKNCLWLLFADAPKEAREYLETRINNGGIVNDYAHRSLEAGEVA